jgi:stress response protein YsnF
MDDPKSPATATNGHEQVIIPVVREELDVQKRTEERGGVVVHIAPKTRTEVFDVSLAQEQVDVERVPVNRVVSAVEPVRQDGDVTIVPVYEEVVVMERRLMLKEEIRITRKRQTKPVRREIELRTEEVHVLRNGGDQQGA